MTDPLSLRIDEVFASVAAGSPHRIALTDQHGEIEYGDLLGQARSAAASLRGLGVGPRDAVLLIGHGGRETVLGMLAVLLAGACYVPVDPGFPAERVGLMADSAQAVLALYAGTPEPAGLRMPAYPVGSLPTSGPSGPLPAPTAGPDDLAYIMFTSGTTGQPKPVGVTHRGVTGLARGEGPLRLSPDDGVLLHSTLAFDASTFEIWSPLLTGGRVVAADRHPPALHELAAMLEHPGVTAAWLTAPVFQLMAAHHGPALGSLRVLVTGGDTVPADTATAFGADHLGTLLVNGYGPTENTTFSTLGPISAWDHEECASFPIGTPLSGTSCYVLDDQLRPVEPGVTGDLFLGGDRLARGYLNRPAATAERFLPDGFTARPGARMYRTGDRARLLPGGALEFRGRTDDEVKVRGFRVDLSEATAVLEADPEVGGAVVLAEPGPYGADLIGFVTPAGTDVRALRERAWQRAPRHLVADQIVPVDAFPLGPTGKLDRAALLGLAESLRAQSAPSQSPAAGPGSPEDSGLADYWKRRTGFDPGPESDFFADGGTSLGLMRLVEDIRNRLGVALDFAEVYAAPTYLELTDLIAARSAAADTACPALKESLV